MKLEWERNAPQTKMTWYDAMEYAKTLGEGWRLPTRAELIEAHDTNIEGFRSGSYWSSITVVLNTNNAWAVNFYNGYVGDGSKTYSNYVRCVREVK